MGATEELFGKLATATGLPLKKHVAVQWLTNRGHLNAAVTNSTSVGLLRSMYSQLGGVETLLAAKKSSPPHLDFVLPTKHLIVEVDEIQHFTTERLAVLQLYPADVSVAFDVQSYADLVRTWRGTGNKYHESKTAKDFPFAGGRRAQRAYFDACRDLLAAAGGMRVLRVPAPECDGALAFRRFESVLTKL